MGQQVGPWTIEQSTIKYRNEHLELCEDRVIKPDGQPGTYATVTLKPGVTVLAQDDEGQVYLARQFRYALGNESMEAVCGGLEDGETPLDAAKRELHEELGILAEDWTQMGRYDADTSTIRGPGFLFLARGLKFTEPRREASEQIHTVKMPLRDAANKVLSGEITHSLSCLLILKALHAQQKT